MKKKHNEVKYGALLSYILIAANAFYGLLIAPYILAQIGESEYGVYKTIASMTASVAVLEFGLGATLQRYIAKFRVEGDQKSAINYSAMGLIQAAVLAVAVLLAGIPLYFSLKPAYGSSFTMAEMVRAKQLLVLMIAFIAIHIFENAIAGIISGYNRFVFTNTMKLSALLLKALLYVVLLPIIKNAVALVLSMLAVELLIIAVEFVYITFGIKHRIKLYSWDRAVFRDSFGYAILLFIQTIIIQFNGNVDNAVIGAVIGTSAVTLYSFAIQLYNMYMQFSTAISGVILPTVIHQLHEDGSPERMEEMTVRFGRVQWMLMGAALFGFICVGKEFFSLWLGGSLTGNVADCWYLSLILMIPVTFHLIVNTFLAVLKAKNLLRFRTIAMAYSLLLNIICTVVGTLLTKNYWIAAIGTALSVVVESVISLNIYYAKKLKVHVLRVYFRIFRGTTPSLLAATAVCLLLNCFIGGSWLYLALKAATFLTVYFGLLYFFGMTAEERCRLISVRKKQSNDVNRSLIDK